MKEVLIDTDILSYYFKKNPKVLQKFDEYLSEYEYINIARPTIIEIVSGLKAKNAFKQLADFRIFISKHKILEITEQSSEISTDYIAHLIQTGKHTGSFDVLIAGITRQNNLTLITNNTKDYENFKDLKIENWA